MEMELYLAERFEKEKTYYAYEELCKITIAHIIVFNRRRAGEVARIPLRNYAASGEGQAIPDEIIEIMMEDEKQAIK